MDQNISHKDQPLKETMFWITSFCDDFIDIKSKNTTPNIPIWRENAVNAFTTGCFDAYILKNAFRNRIQGHDIALKPSHSLRVCDKIDAKRGELISSSHSLSSFMTLQLKFSTRLKNHYVNQYSYFVKKHETCFRSVPVVINWLIASCHIDVISRCIYRQ